MKTCITGLVLGLFGAIAVSVSSAFGWPTWVMFVAWVSYSVFGKSLKSSVPVFIQISLGIVMGILIRFTGEQLQHLIGFLGLPVAVFFFTGSLAFIATLKKLNNIPAWTFGLIILFGIEPELEFRVILELFIPIIFGFLFAWLNDSSAEWAIDKSTPR